MVGGGEMDGILTWDTYDDTLFTYFFFFEGVAEIILKAQRRTSLQCIAARIVNKYDIPYTGIVPKNLENFIGLHGISEYLM